MTAQIAEAAAVAEPIIASVLSKDGRKLFEGLVADAEVFIANNFPRLHVVEGVEPVPDYTVETKQGGSPVDTQVAVPVTSQPNGTGITPAAPVAPAPATPAPDVSSELDALRATVATLQEELSKLSDSTGNPTVVGPVD